MLPYFDFKVDEVAGTLTMRVVERNAMLAKDEQMDGKYALVTNLTEPDGAEILRHYKSRAKIEQRIKDQNRRCRAGRSGRIGRNLSRNLKTGLSGLVVTHKGKRLCRGSAQTPALQSTKPPLEA